MNGQILNDLVQVSNCHKSVKYFTYLNDFSQKSLPHFSSIFSKNSSQKLLRSAVLAKIRRPSTTQPSTFPSICPCLRVADVRCRARGPRICLSSSVTLKTSTIFSARISSRLAFAETSTGRVKLRHIIFILTQKGSA